MATKKLKKGKKLAGTKTLATDAYLNLNLKR